MNPHTQIAPAAELSLAATPGPMNVGAMLEKFIERGVTPENVTAFERLIDLKLKLDQIDAEKQFAAAFAALQAEMPAIQATQPVPNNDGTVRYMFAPYEKIMEQVRPLLVKHGFAISFNSDFKNERIYQTCTLMHVGGHSRSNTFMAAIGRGPPGASSAQADGAASTYAKRFALCAALNITIERDTDAQSVGEPISPEKVQYLKEQVAETRSNERAFLKFAGVEHYEDIGETQYDALVRALEAKKRPV